MGCFAAPAASFFFVAEQKRAKKVSLETYGF